MNKTIQICMGGYGPPSTTHSRAIKMMGDRLIAQFGDKVDIKYVWNVMDFGYKAEEVLWMSERGLLTLAYQSTSYLTERVPELEFADLPFLFASLDEARTAMDGALGAYLSRKIEERIPDYYMLGYFENGYRHVSNRLRAVQHRALLEDAPFDILFWETTGGGPGDLAELRRAPPHADFSHLPDRELARDGLIALARRR